MARSKFGIIGIVVIIMAAATGAYFVVNRNSEIVDKTPTPTIAFSTAPTTSTSALVMSSPFVLLDVPFTSQAPSGDWANPMFQNGCEEASMIIAWHWLNHTPITQTSAVQEITNIANYELNLDENYNDRSAQDTAQLFKKYYNYQNVSYRVNISARDIIAELEKGNLVITPMNGQILGNPFYKAPGPAEHMIVIIGYDPTHKEFITNDPGTRHGKSYRYKVPVFEAAIRDYPTGYHEPISSIQKNMIVVSP